MGGECYSSSSSSLESGESNMGSQRELINVPSARLYLIDGEESVLMTSGEFSLKLLKQTHSPLAVVVASVGEVQWPVGKDAPALKVWNRRYTFALPGLVYGMILPDTTPFATLLHLESILAEYTTFESHHEITNALQFRDDPGFWTAVAPEVETLSSRVARNIDGTSTVVANSIVMGGGWAVSGIEQGAAALMRRKDSDGGVSPRMMKRMQQARRMSAVAKLMSRTLLKGAISATGHVSRNLGLDVNAAAPDAGNVAVASVDAFGKVVQAVETAGKSLFDVTVRAGTTAAQERFGQEAGIVVENGFGAVGDVVNTAWTLNKMGVRMLLRMTAASTALTSRKSRSAASTVTEDQSSTYSTGSMPMKLQYSPPQSLHHEVSLSPALHLLTPAHTHSELQFFPTAAEQLKNQTTVAPSPVYMVTGNYTDVISPVPRSTSPFQQYHWNQVPAPFSFQTPRANMQID